MPVLAFSGPGLFTTKYACTFCGKLIAKQYKHMKTVHVEEKLLSDLENIEDGKEKTKNAPADEKPGESQ